MKLDFTKPLTTMDGRKVVIYKVYEHQERGVHGAYKTGGNWIPTDWTQDGSYFECLRPNECDLVQAPEEIVGWVNVYQASGGLIFGSTVFRSKEAAFAVAGPGNKCIDTIEIKYRRKE